MYSAMQIAHCIINECIRRDKPLNNLKLQNILYKAYNNYFKIHHRRLFKDEFEECKIGHIVRDVYNEYRIYAAMPIFIEEKEEAISAQALEVIYSTIDEYFCESKVKRFDKNKCKGYFIDGPEYTFFLHTDDGETINKIKEWIEEEG